MGPETMVGCPQAVVGGTDEGPGPPGEALQGAQDGDRGGEPQEAGGETLRTEVIPPWPGGRWKASSMTRKAAGRTANTLAEGKRPEGAEVLRG